MAKRLSTSGILLAVCCYVIWGIVPVEARMLVIIMTALSIFGGFSGGGNTAHFAHLGGYVGAWLYLKYIEKNLPAKQWEKKLEGPAANRIEVGDWKRVDMTKVHEVNHDEVLRIVAKIEATGLGSLTSQGRSSMADTHPPESATRPNLAFAGHVCASNAWSPATRQRWSFAPTGRRPCSPGDTLTSPPNAFMSSRTATTRGHSTRRYHARPSRT